MDRMGLPARAGRRAARMLAGAVLLLAGCGGQAAQALPAPDTAAMTAAPTPAAAPVATTAVTIQNFKFSPPVITVPVGATVTWTNQDVEQHTATAGDKSFDSGAIDSGKSYRFTFTKAGSYDYSCLIHPEMVAKVIVTAQ